MVAEKEDFSRCPLDISVCSDQLLQLPVGKMVSFCSESVKTFICDIGQIFFFFIALSSL